MTDSQRDTQQSTVARAISAVHYIKDVPFFELAAQELVFQITQEQDGHELPIYFHMGSYSARDMKDALTAVSFRFKDLGKGVTKVDPGDRVACSEFIDKYFKRMSGVTAEDGSEPTLEMQKAHLDTAIYLKWLIFAEGYGNFKIKEHEESSAPVKSFVIGSSRGHDLAMPVKLYSPTEKRLETIEVRHITRRENAGDYLKYDRASSGGERDRKGWSRQSKDYDTVEQIYDGMILSLQGAVVNGQACTPENKAAWLPLVPVWWKIYVTDYILRTTSSKND